MGITLGLLVGGAMALPYFLNGPDGNPLMSLEPGIDSALSTEKTRQTYYKWQDANGVWQFGDNPPEGIRKVAVNVDTAANVLQSSSPSPSSGSTTERKSTFKGEVPKAGTNAILNPGAAKQAINDAKALQGMMNDRAETL